MNIPDAAIIAGCDAWPKYSGNMPDMALEDGIEILLEAAAPHIVRQVLDDLEAKIEDTIDNAGYLGKAFGLRAAGRIVREMREELT